MESFGAILREKREEKNISIDQVARDTSISRHHIEALEEENLFEFHGVTYALGFLRNYCDYLDLDSAYLVRLCQGKLIQEAPTPENLISKQKITPFMRYTIIGSIIVVTGLTFFILYSLGIFSKKDLEKKTLDLANQSFKTYTLTSAPLIERVYQGDIINVPLGNDTWKLEVVKTLDQLQLKTPIGLQLVDLGEELGLDLDSKLGRDIVVFVSDISKTDEKRGAQLRIFYADSDITGDEDVLLEGEKEGVNGTVLTEQKRDIILTDRRAYPFTLRVNFRGDTLFRYQNDRNPSSENFFTRGDIQIIQVKNGVSLWLANANSVKLQVIADGKTYDLDVARPGQVAVQHIRWAKEADGTYILVVYELN